MMAEGFQSLLDAEWRRRQPRQEFNPNAPPALPNPPMWSYEVTPVLREDWPPTRETAVCYYAYATRFSPRLADGTRIAAPWGRIVGQKFESLTEEIEDIGVQGMWPLNPQDQAAWKLSAHAQKRLRSAKSLPEGKDADCIRTFYKVWVKGNGRIVQAIRPRHAAFFDWL